MPNTDRRRDRRLPLERRVKLMCPLSGRCYAGRTRDYSAGGALLTLDGRWRLGPGQQVRVGIDWTGRQGLIRSDSMPAASVVRAASLDGREHLAIAFEQRQESAAAA